MASMANKLIEVRWRLVRWVLGVGLLVASPALGNRLDG